jgi:hypothetical protein
MEFIFCKKLTDKDHSEIQLKLTNFMSIGQSYNIDYNVFVLLIYYIFVYSALLTPLTRATASISTLTSFGKRDTSTQALAGRLLPKH